MLSYVGVVNSYALEVLASKNLIKGKVYFALIVLNSAFVLVVPVVRVYTAYPGVFFTFLWAINI